MKKIYLIVLFLFIFISPASAKDNTQAQIEELQKQIIYLKKEIADLRYDILQANTFLYNEIKLTKKVSNTKIVPVQYNRNNDDVQQLIDIQMMNNMELMNINEGIQNLQRHH